MSLSSNFLPYRWPSHLARYVSVFVAFLVTVALVQAGMTIIDAEVTGNYTEWGFALVGIFFTATILGIGGGIAALILYPIWTFVFQRLFRWNKSTRLSAALTTLIVSIISFFAVPAVYGLLESRESHINYPIGFLAILIFTFPALWSAIIFAPPRKNSGT